MKMAGTSAKSQSYQNLIRFRSELVAKCKDLELQLPDVSKTLDNPGPLDTKVSNAVDGGERKNLISCLFYKSAWS